jgi:Flp pilus assembly pilin Flp
MMFEGIKERANRWLCWMGSTVLTGGLRTLRERRGQGTTEYAILVGVLVVIAIIAVVAFRGKLQELWEAIATGINGL